MSRGVCLFAHYAADGRVHPSVLHYFAQLRRCGLDVHVALSGTELLTDADRESLDGLGVHAHVRANEGLDFGAWQYLLRTGCAKGAAFVLLANDSVFGPIRELAPIFAAMQARGHDVWGMVESHEVAWHLQSWFVCLTADALRRPAVMRVFDLPFAKMSKAEIILHGEIGLGTAIRAEALNWGACLPDSRRGLRRLVAVNPMHVDWITVLRSRRVPFIKVELLRDNPACIPWFGCWPRMLRRYGSFPKAWIDERIATAPRTRIGTSPQMRLLYVLLTRDRVAALRSLLF